MKTKCHNPIHWAVTLFTVLYFCQPGLLLRACVSTNYCSKAVSVDKAIIVQQIDESQPPDPPPQKKVFAPVIFFIIILAVFSWIIYQLIKLLDKVIPPPDKQPDPPPNSGNTNYPPIVINPTEGPGPATASLNSLKIDSNTPSWGPVQRYDIRDLNYENDCEKFPSRMNYDAFWSTGMTTTTDMLHWEDSHYQVDCYVCSGVGAVRYVYYHYNTNWANVYFTSDYVASNHIAPAWFNLSDGPPKPNQFFRLDPR
jgi:hypothetical protein